MRLLREISGWVPIAIPVTIVLMLTSYLVLAGSERDTDEGFAAHMFQLLLLVQATVMVYFAVKWLPERPREAMQTLALQLIAIVIAISPVFILRL